MTTKEFKMVKSYPDVIIYEGGYWIDRWDYEKLQNNENKFGIDTDKRTKQIKLFLMPK